ncbi:MAG: RNA methyltransferase [Rhizobiaceae bacterium]|nr:RNA methyltransferase [Rhizobiaceae bacterium]
MDEQLTEAAAAGPAVILVEPQMGENIGMVARAMANFGLSDLRIVRPRDGWPNEKAIAAASRATHVVAAARVFSDLRAALADLSYVLATTARERDGFKPVRGPVEAAGELRRCAGQGLATGIMFGRERFGLDNEEISLADEIVTFPVDSAYASLNVAQAVLLMAYEWRSAKQGGDAALPFGGPDVTPARKEEVHGLLAQVEAALDTRGYFRPPAKKAKMVDKLRAVLTRPAFTIGEIKVLRGVISSLDRFSPAMPRGEGSPGDDPRRMSGLLRGKSED